MLRIISNSQTIPQSGGRHGKAGMAVLGFGSVTPQILWCVCPTLRNEESEILLQHAIRQALRRASLNGFQRIGICLERVGSIALPLERIIRVAAETVVWFEHNGFSLQELRLVAADAEIAHMAREAVEEFS